MQARTDDDRVSFVKGLFQETLNLRLSDLATGHPLIVHLDADIYSATLYVLATLNQLLVPGSIVLFDEFSSVQHEFRALGDYTASFMREYEVIGWTDHYYQIAIRITE